MLYSTRWPNISRNHVAFCQHHRVTHKTCAQLTRWRWYTWWQVRRRKRLAWWQRRSVHSESINSKCGTMLVRLERPVPCSWQISVCVMSHWHNASNFVQAIVNRRCLVPKVVCIVRIPNRCRSIAISWWYWWWFNRRTKMRLFHLTERSKSAVRTCRSRR